MWLVRAVEIDEGDTRLAEPQPAGRACVARIRQVVCVLRDGAGAHHRPEASRKYAGRLGPSHARRLAGISDSVGSIRSFPSARMWTRSACAWSRCCAFFRRTARFAPSNSRATEGLIRLDPRWYQASLRFVQAGFLHILDGTDHLLFLLCLVIPFRQFRQLLLIVTSFTVAHSFTLIASAYGLGPDALWFPPLIETLIAMSILYMALENIVGSQQRRPPLDGDLRLRPGARVWLFLRPPPDAAVRRIAPADLAGLLQPGRRTGPASGAGDLLSHCWICCSATWSPSAWGPSFCRRWWPTRPGTG